MQPPNREREKLTLFKHTVAYSHYYPEPSGSSYHYEPPAAPASFAAPPYYQPATGSEGYSGSHEYSSYNYSYPSAPAQEPLHSSHATSSSARPSPPFLEARPPPILSFAAGTSQPSELSQSTSIPEHPYYSRVQQNDGRAFYGTSAAAFSRPERPLEQRQDPTWAATPYHPYKLPGGEPALLTDPAPPPPAPASAPLERRSLSAGSPQLSERSVGSDEDRGERHDAVTVSSWSRRREGPDLTAFLSFTSSVAAFRIQSASSSSSQPDPGLTLMLNNPNSFPICSTTPSTTMSFDGTETETPSRSHTRRQSSSPYWERSSDIPMSTLLSGSSTSVRRARTHALSHRRDSSSALISPLTQTHSRGSHR